MKKWKRNSAVFLAVFLAVIFAVPAYAVETSNGVAARIATNQIEGWPVGPDTYSEAAVLIDADTGAVLYDKGKDEIRYPASITKLMTLLVALENSTLEENVTFTETGIRDVTPDSGNIGMQLGEVMTMKDCLYAAVIQSANEVCAQIAEHIGGTEEQFIEMMNRKAQELGCINTHFVNASGLPDDNHYTTAYDMAKIMQAGLQNETFRTIISTVSYTIPATNLSQKKELHTHVPLIAKESNLYYEGCIGGKTGMTSAAQNTFVAAAERDGSTYIAVTLRAPELGQSCADACTMFDYAFQNFEKQTSEGEGAVTVPKGTGLQSMETQISEEDGATVTQYFYKGQYMGSTKIIPEPTAVPEPTVIPESTAVPETAEEPAAKDADKQEAEPELREEGNVSGEEIKEQVSGTVRILFVIMGVMVVILLILIIALVRKNKKRKNRRRS